MSGQDVNQQESVEPFEVASDPGSAFAETSAAEPGTGAAPEATSPEEAAPEQQEAELEVESAPSADAPQEPNAVELESTESVESEAEPAAEPELDTTALVAEALARIEEKLGESQRLLDRQSEVASRLHAENQALRAGELRKAQLPLVLNILRVYDDIARMAEMTDDNASSDLHLAAEAMVDALERSGVSTMAVTTGEPFDAKRHKVTTIEPATDPEAERTVARVVRAGFIWSDGELVRVSDVAVFKYQPPAKPADEPEEAADEPRGDSGAEPSDTPPAS